MSNSLIPTSSSVPEIRLPASLERRLTREAAIVQVEGYIQAARGMAAINVVGDVTVESVREADHILTALEVYAERHPYAERELASLAKEGLDTMRQVIARTGRSFS